MNKNEQNIARVEAAMDAMKRAMVGVHERLNEGLQLTRTQFEILLMLAEQPKTTSQIAERLFLTQSAVTQTVDTLVRRDLVERHPDEHDRRIIRLHISASGKKISDHICELRRSHMQSLMAKLTAEEVEVLISVTEKLTVLFEETKVVPKVI